jgi:hypothetical protein
VIFAPVIAVASVAGATMGASIASLVWARRWHRWSDEHDYREVRRWATDLDAMDTDTRTWIGDLLDTVADLRAQLEAEPEPAPPDPVPVYGRHREPDQ